MHCYSTDACIVSEIKIKILGLMIVENLKYNSFLTAMQPYPAYIKTLINF